jgi:hypothetical protein
MRTGDIFANNYTEPPYYPVAVVPQPVIYAAASNDNCKASVAELLFI